MTQREARETIIEELANDMDFMEEHIYSAIGEFLDGNYTIGSLMVRDIVEAIRKIRGNDRS